MESLLSVVENAEGDLAKANEAEQRVIEEIRQMGQVALQEWTSRQNQGQTDEFIKDNPQAQRTRKKPSTGTVASDASTL
jgi:histidinol dehydrogenase